jgi:hypothetical protein
MKKADEKPRSTWSVPTRRAFVGMLGAAAAVLALRKKTRGPDGDPPPSGGANKTLWIGHC